MKKQTSTAGERLGKDHLYRRCAKSFAVETERISVVQVSPRATQSGAGLVVQAEPWCRAVEGGNERGGVTRKDWLITRPAEWLTWVNQGVLEEQIVAVRAERSTGWESVLGRANGCLDAWSCATGERKGN